MSVPAPIQQRCPFSILRKTKLVNFEYYSKRSNFISRLSVDKRSGLLSRLTHLAASWGGKDNGFGLAKCCSDDPIDTFPESATTLHFEFYSDVSRNSQGAAGSDTGSSFSLSGGGFAATSSGTGSATFNTLSSKVYLPVLS